MKVQIKDYEYCAGLDIINNKSQFPNYCYFIENIKQNNQILSFLLLPYENNTLTKIIFNDTEKS
jgi:hypothetical protein